MSTISASTTTTTAYKVTADTTGALVLQTGSGPTTAVTIDTSQNVGIGTSSPASQLDISKTGDAVVSLTSAGVQRYQLITRSGGRFDFQDQSAGATRWSVDQSGNLLVGLTTAFGAGTVSNTAQFVSSAQGFNLVTRCSGATSGKYWHLGPDNNNNFVVYNNGNTGVYITDGGTSWSANSDERLKTELKPFDNASQKVCSLRAGTGRYLTDDESVSRSFLIAQDVQAVLPEAVNVQSDEMGTLGLAYTDLIPLLTAALQEQQALITQLQADMTAQAAEIAALKGAA